MLAILLGAIFELILVVVSAPLCIYLVTDYLAIGLKKISLAHFLGVSHHLCVSRIVLIKISFNQSFSLCEIFDFAKANTVVSEEIKLAILLVLCLSGEQRSSDLDVLLLGLGNELPVRV